MLRVKVTPRLVTTPTADVALVTIEAAGDTVMAAVRTERPERAEKRRRKRQGSSSAR